MPLDPNIILGARPAQIDFAQFSPMNAMTNVMKFKQADQESQLNALKLAEYERTRTEEEGAGKYAKTADLSTPEGRAGFNAFGKTGLAYSKALSEQDTANLTRQEKQFTIAKARKEFFAQAQRDTSNNPSNENITAYKQDLMASPLFNDDEKKQMAANAERILAMPISERKTFMASQGSSASDLKPTAPPSMVAEYTFAKTPDGGNFRGSYQDFVTARAAAGRAPAQPVAPTITSIVDPKNPNQMITIDARRYTGGSIGSPGVLGVGGKEPTAAVRENKAEAGKTQLADDLDNLRASFQTLDKMRAIPSTERNVLSNIGSATAATGVGQVLGRFGGTEAQVERDVINSARTRLVNSIKNATGMSAQQLNSNVELQTMLKSISDPGQSVQAALRIIDDIDNAYVKGTGKLPKRGAASADGGVDTNNPLLK
jgi:hypothetical protein